MPQLCWNGSVRLTRRLAASLLTIAIFGIQYYFIVSMLSDWGHHGTNNEDGIHDGDTNRNINEGGYLAWLLVERNRSVPLMQVNVHHRGQSGLGHQLLRLSCVYHREFFSIGLGYRTALR